MAPCVKLRNLCVKSVQERCVCVFGDEECHSGPFFPYSLGLINKSFTFYLFTVSVFLTHLLQIHDAPLVHTVI